MIEKSLRVLLDTNIYGFLCETPNASEFLQRISDNNIIICGSSVIRQELRNIPKKVMRGHTKTRKKALQFYDILVDFKRNYSVTELVKALAQEYNLQYKGSRSWHELENDFLIVATASIHNVDIVISNDERTLTSKESISAYEIANEKFELMTPKFFRMNGFKSMIKWFP